LDYGMLSFLSKFLLYLLKFLNKYLKNFGCAIIVLTILIRLIMFPFTYRGEKGVRERMDYQKKLEYIQKKFKDDKAALDEARAELFKKHGVPGLSSCLPMLLQLPIFLGLSNVLRNSIDLYQAPFFLWIKDLSVSDPYYVLPALTAIFMLWQSLEISDAKGRLPGIAMALVFGAVTASFSAGLAIYLLLTTVLGILQTKLVTKLKRS